MTNAQTARSTTANGVRLAKSVARRRLTRLHSQLNYLSCVSLDRRSVYKGESRKISDRRDRLPAKYNSLTQIYLRKNPRRRVIPMKMRRKSYHSLILVSTFNYRPLLWRLFSQKPPARAQVAAESVGYDDHSTASRRCGRYLFGMLDLERLLPPPATNARCAYDRERG